MKRALCWLLLFVMVIASPAPFAVSLASEPVAAPLTSQSSATNGMIRVWLASISSKSTYNLTVDGTYTISGRTLQNGSSVRVEFTGGRIYVTLDGIRSDMGTDVTFARANGGMRIAESFAPANTYPGDMRFMYSEGSGYLICTLYIEDYIYGVLPYQMDNAYPLEALKAQAILARTYGIKSKRSSGVYDVTDMANNQVFRGISYANARCIQAVDETRGVVIQYNGSYIDVAYTASNGGQTELNSNVWNSASMGYIQMKDDEYDLKNPKAATKTYMIYSTPQYGSSENAYAMIREAIAQRMGGAASSYTINQITDVTLHTPKYAAPSRLYTQMRITAAYNGGNLITIDIPLFPTAKKELNLTINTAENELISVKREVDGFQLTARRQGHGVGLSQRGAEQMANSGIKYAAILGFYFNGIQLVQKSFTSNWTGDTNPSLPWPETPSATVPPSNVPTEITGIVTLANTNSRLNLRMTADSNGTVLARLPNGTSVTVIEEIGTWYKVKYSGLTGYVAKDYVVVQKSPGTGTSTNPITTSTAYVVYPSGVLTVRQHADATALVIGTVPNGSTVSVLESNASWSRIQYGTLIGYVMTQYLSASAPSTTVPPGETTAKVSLNDPNGNLNLRMSPATNAPILMRLPNGTIVKVLEKQITWTKVSIQGVDGYVLNDYLRFEGTTGTANPSATALPTAAPSQSQWRGIVSVSSGSLNLRSQSNGDSDIVTTIPAGAEVVVTELSDYWCGVTYGYYKGYVMRKFLVIDSTPLPSSTPGATATTPPITSTSDKAWAKTSSGTGNLNLRLTTSTSSTVVALIPHGAEVKVLQAGAEWTQVQYGAQTGYVATIYLTFDQQPSTATPSPTTPGVATDEAHVFVKTQSGGPVNMRETASANGRVIAQVAYGTKLQVLQSGTEWTRVSNGALAGYVASQYLSHAEPVPVAGATQAPTSVVVLNTGRTAAAQTNGSVSLRVTANAQADLVAALPDNAPIDVLQYIGTGEWLYIQCGTLKGYALRQDLRLQNAIAYVHADNFGNALTVYASASESASIVGAMQQGTVVTVLNSSDANWIQVRLSDGKTGYALKGSLTIL